MMVTKNDDQHIQVLLGINQFGGGCTYNNMIIRPIWYVYTVLGVITVERKKYS